MNELQTKPETLEDQLKRRSDMVKADCQVIIQNDDDFDAAAKKAEQVKSLEKAIKEYWLPLTQMSYQNWKMLLGKQETMLKSVQEGLKDLGGSMVAYRADRERKERERQEADFQKQKELADLVAFELAEEGVPQEAIDKVKEMQVETPFQAKPMQELRSRHSFVPEYIVTIKKKDGVEAWEDVDEEFLMPSTKAHKEAILNNARDKAKKTGGKPMDGFDVVVTEKATIKGAK